MSRKGERLFTLTQTDRHGEGKGRVRNYARLDTAAARAVQLGWAKVKANGTVTCCWNWEL